MQIHSDCQKLRRIALHLLAAGDLRRYAPKEEARADAIGNDQMDCKIGKFYG